MNETRLDARFDGEAESRFSLELYEKGKCYKWTAVLSKKDEKRAGEDNKPQSWTK